MQASYAMNAASYLGTSADISMLYSTLAVPVTTRGWSAVGSYHHVWSEHFESNVMASILDLDVSLPHRKPSVRVVRYAANLIWKRDDNFRIGAEIGYVAVDVARGAPGLFAGAMGNWVAGMLGGGGGGANRHVSGHGLAGYLYAVRSF
jgi:hypothetical protein